MITETIKQHQDRLRKSLSVALLKDIRANYKSLDKCLVDYEQVCEALAVEIRNDKSALQGTKLLEAHIQQRKKILEILERWISKKEKTELKDVFSDFDIRMQEIIDEMQPHWRVMQAEARFNTQPGDKFIKRTIKAIKKGALKLHVTAFRLGRLLRKKSSADEKITPAWHQKIPAKKLSLWYYENELLKRYIPLADEAFKKVAMLAFDAWQADDALFRQLMLVMQAKKTKKDFLSHYETDFLPAIQKVISGIESERNALRPALMKIFDKIDLSFIEHCEVAGTLESPGFLHPEFARKACRERQRKKLTRITDRRTNTLYALADDWKFNQDIYIFTGNANKSNEFFKSALNKRAELVRKELKRIQVFLEKTRDEIKGTDAGKLMGQLEQLKYNAGKNLYNIIIPDVSQVLNEQGFPELINDTEKDLVNVLSSKSRERILIQGFNPARAYHGNALKSISLMQLIEFDITGELQKSIYRCRKQSLLELEKIRDRLQDMGRMVLFNLESAIIMLQKQADAGTDETSEQAKAGMARGIDRYNDLLDGFNNFINNIQHDFDTAIADFNNSLLELTDNAMVDKIRYRIIKARALKNRERLLRLLSTRSKATFRKGHSKFLILKKGSEARLKQIRDSLGIQQLSKEISVEVTDFLANDREKLQKLPFVYRRLFLNEPLEDAAFYHPRKDEKNTLLNAYQKWKDGSFMATLIYGEKGSGISTFVYMFFEEMLEHKPKIHQLLLTKHIITEGNLLAELGQSLREEAFSTIDEFEAYVREHSPFVLFVDKLHMMYMRQPGGFQLLKRLFEIISSTSRQVFWICSCGLYVARFLDKSIGLFGYFPQLISMKSLEKDKVRSIIMLRHNASGYTLHFLSSAADHAMRGFSKKPEQEQQEMLREKFFVQVNRLARSNISFALQLWLHSTHKIEDNVVYLDSLDALDLSFVHNLPEEVIFALHALVLHEVLDQVQLAQIMHISPRQAYMMLMRLKDRGIVVQQNGMFSIHPLLYRESLSLLQDKNLIH